MMESFSCFLLQNCLAFRSFMSPNRVLPLLISVILSACCFRVWWNLPPNHQSLSHGVMTNLDQSIVSNSCNCRIIQSYLSQTSRPFISPQVSRVQMPWNSSKKAFVGRSLGSSAQRAAPRHGTGRGKGWGILNRFPLRLRNLLGDMTFTGSRTLKKRTHLSNER